jgi:elongator complex protein 4
MTCRIPHSVVEGAIQSGDLICLDVNTPRLEVVFQHMEEILKTESHIPLRICIPHLGSPQWGDLNSQVA